MGTDIIIRCNANGKGQPGRCTNNLAGQFPFGVNPSSCWQSGATAGDAACEKNCVVYATLPFVLPLSVCRPYASIGGTGVAGPTGTVIGGGNSSSIIYPPPRSTGTGTGGSGGNGNVNSTVPATSRGTTSGTPSATRTPIPPTTSPTGPSTTRSAAAAVATQVSVGYLAAVGIAAVYLL